MKYDEKISLFEDILNEASESYADSFKSDIYLFFNDFACNSNYVNLMYGHGLPGYELLYDNGYVRVYNITGDNL